jgi:hypothetical protein
LGDEDYDNEDGASIKVAGNVKIAAFWVSVPCRLVYVYQDLRGDDSSP